MRKVVNRILVGALTLAVVTFEASRGIKLKEVQELKAQTLVTHIELDPLLPLHLMFAAGAGISTTDFNLTKTIVGSHNLPGDVEGSGENARFQKHLTFTSLAKTELVVADKYNNRLRMVDRLSGNTSSLEIGKAVKLHHPTSIAVNENVFYVIDSKGVTKFLRSMNNLTIIRQHSIANLHSLFYDKREDKIFAISSNGLVIFDSDLSEPTLPLPSQSAPYPSNHRIFNAITPQCKAFLLFSGSQDVVGLCNRLGDGGQLVILVAGVGRKLYIGDGKMIKQMEIDNGELRSLATTNSKQRLVEGILHGCDTTIQRHRKDILMTRPVNSGSSFRNQTSSNGTSSILTSYKDTLDRTQNQSSLLTAEIELRNVTAGKEQEAINGSSTIATKTDMRTGDYHNLEMNKQRGLHSTTAKLGNHPTETKTDDWWIAVVTLVCSAVVALGVLVGYFARKNKNKKRRKPLDMITMIDITNSTFNVKSDLPFCYKTECIHTHT